jgi:CsoR family transcriptional regulator, copper-sensing transcriptional repressor
VKTDTRQEALKRLNYIDGHLSGIRRMIEEDQYCVDVLHQTHAVRSAIEKLEALLLEGHLHTCVIDGIKDGREDNVLGELMQLFDMAHR